FHAKASTAPTAGALVALDNNAKLPYAAFPVGTTAGTLAAGDHTHTTLGLTSMTVGSLTLNEDVLRSLLRPTQLTPAEGAVAGSTPTFTWLGVPPFTVEVAAASAPGTVLWSANTSGTTATVSPALSAGTSYVWRVHGKGGGADVVSPDRGFKALLPV